jgi:two-component system, cell cycle sensor histidine kinase and response regulator CckA
MQKKASYEELERRIEGLQRELRRTSRFEAINRVLLGISETVCRATALDELFASIRSVLSSVIDTSNFSIALYDADQDSLSFPYCVDTLDPGYGPVPPGQSSTETLTGEVVRIARPLFATRDEIHRRFRQNDPSKAPGPVAEVWLGVPLLTDGELIGVMAVQSYTNPDLYNPGDIEVMTSVAGQIALAIERKRREKELEQSMAHLQSIFRAAPVGIGVTVDRVMIKANQRLCELTGYAREELIDRSARMLYLDDAGFDHVGRVKYMQIRDHDTGTVETRWRRKDGAVIDVLLSSTPLDVRDIGKGVTFTALDITARKQVQAERERLRVAIEQAAEIIVITDPDGTINYANPAFEKISGYGPAEVLGSNMRILKSGRHDAVFYRELWQSISGGDTWKGQVINRRKDGTLFTEEATISPVCDSDGRIVNYVAVKRDISENLMLAEQLQHAQKMEAVARLTGGVAHDFNNILMIIIGYAEIALAQLTPGQPLHADLEKILDAANRSAEIVRQLLTFARKQTIDPIPLNLNSAVEHMLKIIHRLIGENVELRWKPAGDLWLVNMDPAQVDQVLANLCVNARDAITGAGRVTIATDQLVLGEKSRGRLPDLIPGEYVLLTVSDNGSGMDRKTMQQIFEPFFTTKGVGEGTGLGLAMVYGIIKQNNGFIEVISEPGKGTMFKMYLPRYRGDGRETRVGSRVEPDWVGSGQAAGEMILLVEDDLTILDMEKNMLEGLGYRVLAANRPKEALRLARRHAGEIDLLITDVIMPEMNGWELATRLVGLYPGIRQLFMSGYTADVIARHGVLDEGLQFIEKPFSARDLARRIRQVLEGEQVPVNRSAGHTQPRK